MKFNGTVYKTVRSPVSLPFHVETPFGQDKIGTYSVQASKKWSSVFTLYQVGKKLVRGTPTQRLCKHFSMISGHAWFTRSQV
jgi:hypothetical protein